MGALAKRYLFRRQVEETPEILLGPVAAQEVRDQQSRVYAVRREYQILFGRRGHGRLQQLDAERLLPLEQVELAGQEVVERQTGTGRHALLLRADAGRYRHGGNGGGQYRPRGNALNRPRHVHGFSSRVPATEMHAVSLKCTGVFFLARPIGNETRG